MNYIDIFMAIPLLWGLYKGFSKGFIIEVASLAALLLGIYGGLKFSGRAAIFLREQMAIDTDFLPLIAFAVVFVIIVIAVYMIGKALERVVNFIAMKPVNKLAGAIFGLVKTGLILSVVLVIVEYADEKLHFMPEDTKKSSLLYHPVSKIAPAIYSFYLDVG